MRRASTGAIALALGLLLLGGILDSTVNRDAVGRSVDGRADPTLVGLARDRYVPLALAAEVASGARVVLDADRPGRFRPLEVIAFSGGRSVEILSLEGLELPERPPTRFGEDVFGRWTITVADGPVDTLVIVGSSTATHIIDARLLAGSGAEFPVASREPIAGVLEEDRITTSPPTRARAVTLESALLLFFVVIGGSLLRRDLGGTSLRLPLGFIVGVGLTSITGLLRLPSAALIPATVIAAAAIAIAGRRSGAAIGWRANDLPAFGLAAPIILLIVHQVRSRGLVTAFADSFDYLVGGRLLAEGRLPLEVLELKRGLGQQTLHAIGFQFGLEGLLALGPALLIAVTLLLSRALARPGVLAIGSVAVLAAPQIVTMAVYVNSHFLVAALLLAAVVLLGLDEGKERGDVATAVAVAVLLAAVVLLRAEGTLLAGLLLLGTLAARRRAPSAAWWGLGGATIAWNGLLIVGAVRRAEAPATVVIGLALLGVILLTVPALLRSLSDSVIRVLPVVTGAGLWLAAGLLLSGRIGNVVFLDAVVANVGAGAGGWGTAGPVLAALGVLGVGLGRRKGDGRGLHAARWALVGAVPLAMITKLGDGLDSSEAGLEVLLSGGGRVGWADSVNRMWMHVVLLVVLLTLLRLRSRDPEGTYGQRLARAAVLVPILLWLGVMWQPQFIGEGRQPASVEVRRELLDVQPGDLIGELLAGARLTQEILVSPVDDPPADATRVRVCIRPLFVTFGRELTGAMDMEVRTVAATVRTRIDVAGIEDLADGRACILLPEDAQTLTGLTVVLSSPDDGAGSPEGSGVGLLSGIGGGLQPPARFVTPLRAGREVTEDGPLAMRVDVRYFVPADQVLGGTLVRASDAATRWMPRAVAGLVSLVLLIDLRRRPVDRSA